MLKTLREFLNELDPQSWIDLGYNRMKVYEALGKHTYLDGFNCIPLNLDTYNYRYKFNEFNGIYKVNIYE